jgi:hypothetical protein
VGRHVLGLNPLSLNHVNTVMDKALRGHPYVKSAIGKYGCKDYESYLRVRSLNRISLCTTFIHLLIELTAYLMNIFLLFNLSICVSDCASDCASDCVAVCLSVCLTLCLSVCLLECLCLSVCLCVFLSVRVSL